MAEYFGSLIRIGLDVRSIGRVVCGFFFSFILGLHVVGWFAQGIDRDCDTDGVWDASRGVIDCDIDNDGLWDYED